MLRLSVAVILLAIVGSPATVEGQTPGVILSRPEAQAHVERAEQAYAAQDYRTASTELAAAYALEPRRELLFAWAQAERLGGRCERAVELYERFLALAPPPDEAQRATRQLERCRRLLGAKPRRGPPRTETLASSSPSAAASRPTPASRPVVAPRATVAPKPAVTPAAVVARPAAPRPWYRDWWGNALLITSGVTLATGAGLLGGASSSEAAAGEATSYGSFHDNVQQADSYRRGGAVLVSVGAALGVAAVLCYLLRAGGPGR